MIIHSVLEVTQYISYLVLLWTRDPTVRYEFPWTVEGAEA